MLKKLIIILSIIFVTVSINNISLADDLAEDENGLPDFNKGEIIHTSTDSSDDLTINSKIAIAYDRKSGKAVWGKNENKRTAMASTTKIMTAIVVVENAKLDDIVTVSAKAAGTGGSRLGLKKGDKISVKDLLYGLMLRSGNDAAIALSEHIEKNGQNFANLMNEKASELDLKDTHFVTPHGLDNPDHYTTAFELAKITDYALHNEIIAKVVGSKYYTITINGYPKNLINTNELLGSLNGVYGVKTGFTNNAGRCLVTSVKKGDIDIITVVIQADTKKDRSRDSIKIIDYIFDSYSVVNLQDMVNEEFDNWKSINKNRIRINKAKNAECEIRKTNLKDEEVLMKNSDINRVKVNISSIYNFEAPVKKKTQIGVIIVTVDDEIVDKADIYIDTFVERKNILDYFFECIKSYK